MNALCSLLLPADLEPMHDRQRLVAIVGAGLIVLVVFELVRRRKLREEYSWLWIVTATLIAGMAIDQELLLTLTSWIGAASSASTLFLFGILFLIALSVQFSVRLSRITHRQRTLAQRMALLEEQLAEARKDGGERKAKADGDGTRKRDQDEVA